MEQNNNTFNVIRSMIDNLDLYIEMNPDAVIAEAIYNLSEQFERAGSAEWQRKELNDFIFDNDILDFVANNDVIVPESFKTDVREIQHAIINFFEY